ncbi:uncharacterized protein LOC125177640 [Hyalella azteca]|uniref:Uncharacterized protein LOC125177640 n=1 Tax=Hyalella azteca TaxID=294128 RepID=A0A979FGL2_HYAAZ|nr:uncharacterized protein LOC125177640 [Hyalella azteca]
MVINSIMGILQHHGHPPASWCYERAIRECEVQAACPTEGEYESAIEECEVQIDCLTRATPFPADDAACTRTFAGGNSSSHWCPSSCTAYGNTSYSAAYGGRSPVTGTLLYDENSPVCLAALHAGVLQAGEDKEVLFRSLEVTESFVGTVRNRVISQSREVEPGRPQRAFAFSGGSSHTPSEAKLAGAAVIMVYNAYRNNVSCISSSSDARLPHPYFTRWDYTPVTASPPSVVITSEPNYLQATFEDVPDPPVLRCLSDEPERDVTASISRGGQ